MRYPASEKIEIIRLVEQSHLPIRQTLDKIGIPRAIFYRWYDLYQTDGPEALENRSPRPRRVWNRISDAIRAEIARDPLSEAEKVAVGGQARAACARAARAVAPRIGGVLHGYGKVLCIGGFGVSPAQGA